MACNEDGACEGYTVTEGPSIDGGIAAWGWGFRGGDGEPTSGTYTYIASTNWAFAAIKDDGSIAAWGMMVTVVLVLLLMMAI